MRKVKFRGNDMGALDTGALTKGKVYDCIDNMPSNIIGDSVFITNDFGDIREYYMSWWFEDITHEIRNEIIDEILL